LAIDVLCKVFGLGNIDPPCCSHRMKGIPLKDPEGYQPLPTDQLKGSPQQSEVQDTTTSQVERIESLEHFQIFDSLESF
jgi:hypothetical protein